MFDLDAYELAAAIPDGLRPGSDSSALTTGKLLGLDPDRGLAQVSIAGSEGLWVPAQPAIYPPFGMVRLQRSALDGGRVTACIGPVSPGQMLVGGTVKAVNAAAGLLTVITLGGSFDLPYPPGTYSVGAPVHVVRSASRYGLPEFVLGPLANYTPPAPEQPGSGSTNPGRLVDRQATILPQWSGSWRSAYSRWDSWNTDRYGGRSTLWQGSGAGSGQMIGLATYGDQVTALGAQQITRMLVSVYRADSSFSNPRAAVLQASPHGARPGGAPTGAGATVASPGLTPGQGAQVDLPGSVFESFRTGASRGLVLVGGDYAGFSGTPDRSPVRADGMALVVQYKVLA
ncbi:hypothetical protein M4D51_08055 [Microbacterium sp. p3-SID338]|uniref:hypothetical protein n=1 Tax=Microbacterium sp. p3-SID338 TaxID=2916214 RepID=UPI0021A5701A|nr:hypothetical protein [Microbacterium sp. p3-SID338]MCT1395678.1 hypothetical protein [Microbacterium sp. p3-SID338]